jgi:hypothetical protein
MEWLQLSTASATPTLHLSAQIDARNRNCLPRLVASGSSRLPVAI